MAIYRVNAQSVMDGNIQQHIWWIGGNTATEDDVLNKMVALHAVYANFLAPHMSVAWRFNWMSYQNVSVAGMPVIPFPVVEVVGEQVGNQYLPLQIAAVISFRANTAKPNKAIKFIGGLVEGQTDAGVFRQDLLAGLGLFCDAIVDMSDPLDPAPFCCAHYDILEHRVTAANRISRYSISGVPGTLRRRRKGRGI